MLFEAKWHSTSAKDMYSKLLVHGKKHFGIIAMTVMLSDKQNKLITTVDKANSY